MRTKLNATTSDATLRIAVDFSSPGELLTERCCKENDKQMFDIYVKCDHNSKNKYSTGNSSNRYDWVVTDDTFSTLINADVIDSFWKWVDDNDIKILNVAGNSNQTFANMFDLSVGILTNILSERFTKQM